MDNIRTTKPNNEKKIELIRPVKPNPKMRIINPNFGAEPDQVHTQPVYMVPDDTPMEKFPIIS